MHYETSAVFIQVGPFTGFKGIVVSTRLERVTVRIILKQRHSILVELDPNMIEGVTTVTFSTRPMTNAVGLRG